MAIIIYCRIIKLSGVNNANVLLFGIDLYIIEMLSRCVLLSSVR